jgi:hypothetical protein
LVYRVTWQQLPNHSIDVEREVNKTIEQHKLRGATDDEILENEPKLKGSFQELRTGFTRNGTMMIHRSGEAYFVQFFAPSLGAGTAEILEYYDGDATITADRFSGEAHQSPLTVRLGDSRTQLRTPSERVVFFSETVGEIRLIRSVDVAFELLEYEVEGGFVCSVMRRKDDQRIVSVKTFHETGDKRVLTVEATVRRYDMRDGELIPAVVDVSKFMKSEKPSVQLRFELSSGVTSKPTLATFFPKTTAIDYRFGAKPANYAWPGYLPSKSEIPEDAQALVSGVPSLGLTVSGLGLVLVGGGLWLRTRKCKEVERETPLLGFQEGNGTDEGSRQGVN